jgi:arsenate reductase
MAKPVVMHGIKNCDTVKKARAWLDKQGVAYTFRDYKTDAPQKSELETWAKAAGWESLLNRAGTTFKKLPDQDKQDITASKALALMLAQPSMIKRPVLDVHGKVTVGFKPDVYGRLFP